MQNKLVEHHNGCDHYEVAERPDVRSNLMHGHAVFCNGKRIPYLFRQVPYHYEIIHAIFSDVVLATGNSTAELFDNFAAKTKQQLLDLLHTKYPNSEISV